MTEQERIYRRGTYSLLWVAYGGAAAMAIFLIGSVATIMFASAAFYSMLPWLLVLAFAAMIYGGIIAALGPGEHVEGGVALAAHGKQFDRPVA